MNQQHRILVIVGVVAVIALGFGLYRSGIIGSRHDAYRQEDARRMAEVVSRRKAGERCYASLTMQQVGEPSTAGGIAAVYVPLYMDVTRESGVTLPDRDVAAIAKLASEFLYHRYFAPSPDAYIEWMDRSGYRWIDADMMRAYLVEEDWKYFYPDEPFPGYESPGIVFSRLWMRQEKEKTIRVTGVSADTRSVTIAASIAQWPDVLLPLPPDTDELTWSGQVGTMRRWFTPKSHEYRKYVAQTRQLQMATVAFIVVRESGRRDPLALFLYKGPGGKWYIRSVIALNMGPNSAIAQEM
ncbi:MAG: hypothetical protein KIT54_11355 [Phycisphaeraceae bacterium]|nr:hypothetical protein [Phycisphaeraceae bacterium]